MSDFSGQPRAVHVGRRGRSLQRDHDAVVLGRVRPPGRLARTADPAARQGQWLELGAVDRRPDDRDPHPADPAVRQADPVQPEMKELQKKHGHDREKLGQEMMKLYKETGTNPFASCLPLLLQSPVFIALFRVLDGASRGTSHSSIIRPHVESLRHAKIFGAEISATFLKAPAVGGTNVKIVAIVLIVLMTATMFTTQLQLMRKNMPKEALEGQAAQMQKIMLYVFPLFFLAG